MALYTPEGGLYEKGKKSLISGQEYDLDRDGHSDILWEYGNQRNLGRRDLTIEGVFRFLSQAEQSCLYSIEEEKELASKGILKWVEEEGTGLLRKVLSMQEFNMLGHDAANRVIRYAKEKALLLAPEDYLQVQELGLFRKISQVVEIGNEIRIYYEEAIPELEDIFEEIKCGLNLPSLLPQLNVPTFDDLWGELGIPSNEEIREKGKFFYKYEEDFEWLLSKYATLTISPRFKIDTQIIWDFEWKKGLFGVPNGIKHLAFGLEGAYLMELMALLELAASYEATPCKMFSIPIPQPLTGIITIGAELTIGVDFKAEVTGAATIGYRNYCDQFRWYAEYDGRNWDIYDGSGEQNVNQFKSERIGPEYSLEGSLTVKPYLSIAPYISVFEGAARASFGLTGLVELTATGTVSNTKELEIDAGIDFGIDYVWRASALWNILNAKGDGKLIRIDILDFGMDFPWAPYSLHSPSLTAIEERGTGVQLNWESDSKVTDGYEIRRKIAGGEYVKIKEVKGLGTKNYTDTSAVEGNRYWYRVRGMADVEFELLGSQIEEAKDWKIPSFWSNVAEGEYRQENQTCTIRVESDPAIAGQVRINGGQWGTDRSVTIGKGEP